MTSVAVIGLGMIGGGVTHALAGKGFSVRGYDLRPEAFDGQPAALERMRSPAAAADGATAVLIAVMDDAQVRAALAGPEGVLSASAPPRTVVILSTVTLETVRWAASEARSRSVEVLDCGVSGGPQALAQAAITAMVGGDEDAVAVARPVLEGFADPVVHCGPLGNGMRAKLARNLTRTCALRRRSAANSECPYQRRHSRSRGCLTSPESTHHRRPRSDVRQ